MSGLKNITVNTVLTLKLNIEDSIYIEKGTCLELLKNLSILDLKGTYTIKDDFTRID